MQDLLKTEENDSERMLHNIHDLATQLYQNVSWSLYCCGSFNFNGVVRIADDDDVMIVLLLLLMMMMMAVTVTSVIYK